MGDKIRRYKKADISVAVQTPQGLMVPVVRNACGLGLTGISGEVKELAGKAKEGKLGPTDMIGGTFTISNLGMFGVKSFAAIVNPPQAAILAVGAARREIVKKTDGSGYEEAMMMSATLSCDHRVVDGADGATWLGQFKGFMEDPVTMLL
jgi:pyruvate dehydrogenase E2 component (dihydrolipoamide acetyltransferase)